jgi:hypothetical protein
MYENVLTITSTICKFYINSNDIQCKHELIDKLEEDYNFV